MYSECSEYSARNIHTVYPVVTFVTFECNRCPECRHSRDCDFDRILFWQLLCPFHRNHSKDTATAVSEWCNQRNLVTFATMSSLTWVLAGVSSECCWAIVNSTTCKNANNLKLNKWIVFCKCNGILKDYYGVCYTANVANDI